MYKLRIEPAPDSDASAEEYAFVVKDLAASIADRFKDVEEDEVIIDRDNIIFHTSHTEKEIKDILRPIFSHHFDILRFSAIEKC